MESRWTLRVGLVAERFCQVDGGIERYDEMALGEPGLQRGGALQAAVRRAVILASSHVETLVEVGDAGQLVGLQRGQELLADGAEETLHLARPATQLMLSSGVPSCVPHSLCSTRSRAQLIPGRAAEVGMGSVHMERLTQLSELHKSGALTDDEFASKKAEILALAPIGFVEEEPSAEAAPAAPPAKKEEPTTAATVFGGIVFLIVVAGIVAIVSNTGDREPEPDPIGVSAGVGIVNRRLSALVRKFGDVFSNLASSRIASWW